MPSPSAYTPPSPDTEKPHHRLPPSPPLSPTKSPRLSPVDRLLGVLRLYRAGKQLPGDSDWRTFPLSAVDLVDFERRLAEDTALSVWFKDKPRYDYDGRSFTLRMPSAVHESFIVSVEGAISAAISELAGRVEEGAVKDALKSIWLGRSTTLELRAPALENSSQESSQEGAIVRRSPDATFWCKDAGLPNLVVEVSYSQQKKDLPRLAESYIVDSRHAIKCVVGLDIPYGKGDASVSVWRAGTEAVEGGEEVGICRCDVDGEVFRREDGEAGEGELELRVGDLVPEDVLVDDTAEKISIPFADLSVYFSEAITRSTPKQPTKTTPSQPKKFRKRKRSPEEGLSSGREDEYARLEAADLEREKAEDGAWRARSRRRMEATEAMPVRRSRRRSARVDDGEAG